MTLNNEEQRWIDWTLDTQPTIAVVGLSDNPARPSYQASAYLIDHGFKLIPINPRYRSVLGLPCYASLTEVPEPIDVVNLFQAADKVTPFVEEAIRIGARLIWMQLDIINTAAAERARLAGLGVVMARCIKIEHERRHTDGQ